MIRIIHVSDLHFGRRRDNATQNGRHLLEKIFNQYSFATAKDTYLLASGDFVDGEDLTDIANQWRDARDAFTNFRGKILCCAGNHDQEWGGELNHYGAFCSQLEISSACSVPKSITDGVTIIDTLGIDSTWWSHGLGIAGIGRIDTGELDAAKNFAASACTGWKLLYLHHRPVQPTLIDEAKLAMYRMRNREGDKANIRNLFLGLRGANALLETIAGKVDVMAFGHDKGFATDFDKYRHPTWVNANREDTCLVGWNELTFELNNCAVRVFNPDGVLVAQGTISNA